VYGENGAGKSSLFHAISDFLESPDRRFYDEKTKVNRPLKVSDNQNRFTADEAVIRLSFSAPQDVKEARPDRVYEWSTAKNDPRVAEMRTVDKGKGCLDYRSLLRVHSLPGVAPSAVEIQRRLGDILRDVLH
jgi:ATPase subunit of ABC transporter with duplicated ATPase domains